MHAGMAIFGGILGVIIGAWIGGGLAIVIAGAAGAGMGLVEADKIEAHRKLAGRD